MEILSSIENIINKLTTEFILIIFIPTFIIVIIKDFIINLLIGLKIYYGKSYNEGDIVYINNIKHRIIKIGVYSTVFELFDNDNKDNNKWLIIENNRFKYLMLYKHMS